LASLRVGFSDYQQPIHLDRVPVLFVVPPSAQQADPGFRFNVVARGRLIVLPLASDEAAVATARADRSRARAYAADQIKSAQVWAARDRKDEQPSAVLIKTTPDPDPEPIAAPVKVKAESMLDRDRRGIADAIGLCKLVELHCARRGWSEAELKVARGFQSVVEWPHTVARFWRKMYDPNPQTAGSFSDAILAYMRDVGAPCDPASSLPDLVLAFQRALALVFDDAVADARIEASPSLRRLRKVERLAKQDGVARGRVMITAIDRLLILCADDEAAEKLRARFPDAAVECVPETFAAAIETS
jgi:hypothetical protein